MTLVNSHYAVDGYAMFTLGLLTANRISQIAVDGRKIGCFPFIAFFMVSLHDVINIADSSLFNCRNRLVSTSCYCQ